MSGRYDHLLPEMRVVLERAEAARIWLTRPGGSAGIQEVHDLCAAREILQSYEIAQARVAAARDAAEAESRLSARLSALEREVRALRRPAAPHGDAPGEPVRRPCGVGWPPPCVTG